MFLQDIEHLYCCVLCLSVRTVGEKERNQVSAQLSPFRSIFQLCFMRRIADGFQVGTEFSLDHAGGNVLGSVGYQADLPRANLSFKSACLDYIDISICSTCVSHLAYYSITILYSASSRTSLDCDCDCDSYSYCLLYSCALLYTAVVHKV